MEGWRDPRSGQGTFPRPDAPAFECGQGTGVLSASRPAGLSNAPGICLHEGAAPRFCQSLDVNDDRPPRACPRGLTPHLQGCSLASLQPGDFHAPLRGNDGRNRRSPSPSHSQHYRNLRQGRLRWPALTGSPLAHRRCTMSPLEQALTDYLSIRRSLGFRLREPGTCLRSFVAFLQIAGASYITRELALRWATQPVNAQPSTWAWRLGMVRRFALWH